MSDDIPGGLQRGRYRTASNKKSTNKKPYNRFALLPSAFPAAAQSDDEVETKVITPPAKPGKKPGTTAETE